MSTVVIDVDDQSSVKLFLALARKLHFKAKVLPESQKEDLALSAMMKERAHEEGLPADTALSILKKKEINNLCSFFQPRPLIRTSAK